MGTKNDRFRTAYACKFHDEIVTFIHDIENDGENLDFSPLLNVGFWFTWHVSAEAETRLVSRRFGLVLFRAWRLHVRHWPAVSFKIQPVTKKH